MTAKPERVPSVPLVEVPATVQKQLADFGAPRRAATGNLYRALANQPEMLTGWVEMAWRIRQEATTDRRLRELMIVRGARMSRCEYEQVNHEAMARAVGVTDQELGELDSWRDSRAFSPSERAGLALMEEMHGGTVTDATLADLHREFEPAERVELIVTAGFYAMVPRVIEALRLPVDQWRH
jgi:4-carboxymuconolactone decarboxylase